MSKSKPLMIKPKSFLSDINDLGYVTHRQQRRNLDYNISTRRQCKEEPSWRLQRAGTAARTRWRCRSTRSAGGGSARRETVDSCLRRV
jgi:hypothetical protein